MILHTLGEEKKCVKLQKNQILFLITVAPVTSEFKVATDMQCESQKAVQTLSGVWTRYSILCRWRAWKKWRLWIQLWLAFQNMATEW